MKPTKVIDGVEHEQREIDGKKVWVPVEEEMVTVHLPQSYINLVYDVFVTALNDDGEFSGMVWQNFSEYSSWETFSDEAKEVMEKMLTYLYYTCVPGGNTDIEIYDYSSTKDVDRWFVKLVKEKK